MSSPKYIRAIVVVLLILGLGLLVRTDDEQDSAVALAQSVSAQSQAADNAELARVGAPGQEYDRQTLLLTSQRAGAKSGWRRGEEIFYMRCWICHSEYVIVSDHFPAPSLRNLYDRYDDESVRAIIRAGSTRMPTYGPQVLTAADLDDLVTFLRENCGTSETGGGCFDEHNPPPNPFYAHEVTGLTRRQD
jgi:mono/diheme cytochrome c family protein